MSYITVSVDVDVELSDISTDDLLRELKRRVDNGEETDEALPGGFDPVEGKNATELAEACFEARRRGDDARALELVDRLIYASLGRII